MNYFDRIAISGKMASGKTTVSNFLIDSMEYNPIRSAEYLKLICSNLADLNLIESVNSPSFVLKATRSALMTNTKFISKDKEEMDKLFIEFETLRKEFSHVKSTKKKTEDVREMLQTVAKTISENVREDIWVQSSIKKMNQFITEDKLKIVHDDLRYQFEFEELRRQGFVTVRLNVSPEVQAKRVKTLYGKVTSERFNHISEIDLDNVDFDYIIDADQPLIDMLQEIKNIMTE